MSESGRGSPTGGDKRAPKVGVYIPRHRRQNDNEEPTCSNSGTTPNSTTTTYPSATRHANANINSNHQNHLANSNNNYNNKNQRDADAVVTSGEVQRRGRGTFKGPSSSSTFGPNEGQYHRSKTGNSHNSNGSRSNRNNGRPAMSGYDGGKSLSPSTSSSSSTSTVPRHAPRGRDFDATVLRRYSDDENRPNSGFSRYSSYNSGGDNHSSNNYQNNNSITSAHALPGTEYNRSSDRWRNRPAQADTRPRNTEKSWRRDDQESENTDLQLSKHMARVKLGSEDNGDSNARACWSNANQGQYNDRDSKEQEEDKGKEGKENEGREKHEEEDGQEEKEEWELALENSDEDAIPKAPVPDATPKSKPPSATPSKVGNWSDVISEDLYILELYDFSSTLRTAHLTELFTPYENRMGGYRIKWLDDLRALVIFESSAIAKQAYAANQSCQIAKIRPYTGADKEAIRNEGKSTSTFNAPRPAKTDAVAKRLVHGALGLRVRRTPEQIAEEKALVKAAREAREAQRQEQERQRLEQERQRREMDAVFNF